MMQASPAGRQEGDLISGARNSHIAPRSNAARDL
jgi:hypothetical protein